MINVSVKEQIFNGSMWFLFCFLIAWFFLSVVLLKVNQSHADAMQKCQQKHSLETCINQLR